MRTPELRLPVLTPLEGGLARLRRATAQSAAPRTSGPRLALASTAALLALVSALPAYKMLDEREFHRRLDQAIRQMPDPEPVHAEGYVLSFDGHLGNEVRVIELHRDQSGTAARGPQPQA